MTPAEIRDALHRAILQTYQSSNRPAPTLHGGICPMGDMEGFDSFNAMEVGMHLSVEFGCEIKEDVELFYRDGQNRSIDDIVEDLCEILDVPIGDTYEQ